MPEPRDEERIKQWIKDTQQAAGHLIRRAEEVCQRIFNKGDLTRYLTLLSRFSNYDSRNLLLLLDQYPNATHLGAFKAWKNLLSDPSVQVLKEEWKGRGIEFLAPFTVYQNGKYSLVWYTVKQFDISQTNVTCRPAVFSAYIQDQQHISYLTAAAQAALSYLFHKSLLLQPAASQAIPAHMPFRITENGVLMRSGQPPLEHLKGLTEALACLSAIRSAIPNQHRTLFIQCICHCLFQIWGLPKEYPPPIAGSGISGIPQNLRGPFLALVQRTLRQIEESIACAYLEKRRDILSDDLDDDLAALLFENET